MEWYSSLFSRHVFKYLTQLLIYKCRVIKHLFNQPVLFRTGFIYRNEYRIRNQKSEIRNLVRPSEKSL